MFHTLRKSYLPVGLKQSETSHGSTNFHFAESRKELQSTFLSPTRSGYSSGWELEFLTKIATSHAETETDTAY